MACIQMGPSSSRLLFHANKADQHADDNVHLVSGDTWQSHYSRHPGLLNEHIYGYIEPTARIAYSSNPLRWKRHVCCLSYCWIPNTKMNGSWCQVGV